MQRVVTHRISKQNCAHTHARYECIIYMYIYTIHI